MVITIIKVISVRVPYEAEKEDDDLRGIGNREWPLFPMPYCANPKFVIQEVNFKFYYPHNMTESLIIYARKRSI